MATKKDLLKELGWNKELIQHFMVDDSTYHKDQELEYQNEVFESNTLTFTYNAQVSGQYVIQQTQNLYDRKDL